MAKTKKSVSIQAAQSGLSLGNGRDFFRKVTAALTSSLDVPFARHTLRQEGLRQLNYIEVVPPRYVEGRTKSLPAILMYSGPAYSVFLIVEAECRAGADVRLQHLSLKVYQGTTDDSTVMCFRAEWDFRDPSSIHAQPHWNVHAPVMPSSDIVDAEPRESFIEYAERQEPSFVKFLEEQVVPADEVGPPVPPPKAPLTGFSAERMHEFHFGMATTWQVRAGSHSPAGVVSDDLARWVGECARYIKGQFHYLNG